MKLISSVAGLAILVFALIVFASCNRTMSRVTVVQHESGWTASGTSVAVTFNSNVTAGDLVLVAESSYSGSTLGTPADSQGNTYTQLVTASSAGYSVSAIYLATAESSGADTVICSINNANNIHCHIYEISGASAVVDQTGTSVQTGTALSVSTSAATTSAGDYVFAYFSGDDTKNTFTPGSGWGDTATSDDSIAGDCAFSEDKVVSATGVQMATATASTSDTFVNLIVALKSATDGVPSAPTDLTAIAASSSQINLIWTASSGATSYNLLRSTTSGSGYASIATGVTTTSYSSTGLSASTTYYYVVQAVDSSGTSGNSTEASAATLSNSPTPINQLDGAPYLNSMIPMGPTFGTDSNASFSVSSAWDPSGSAWQFPWWEPNVFQEVISVTESGNSAESFTLRVGRAGQMYSFQTPLLGELTPPQTVGPGNSNVSSPWIDDNFEGTPSYPDHVEQPGLYTVQLTPTDGSFPPPGEQPDPTIYTYEPAMPFYAPRLAQTSTSDSYSVLSWTQSPGSNAANGNMIQGANGVWGIDDASIAASGIRYRALGQGVLEQTYTFFNFGNQTDGMNNVAMWGGVRETSLPYEWDGSMSTFTASNATFQPSDANNGYTNQYPFTAGNTTMGYTVWSNGTSSSSPAVAFVYGLTANAYLNDLFYAMASQTATSRDFLVWSYVQTGDTSNGLNYIPPGQGYYMRGYWVFDTLGDIASKISSLGLVADATQGFIPNDNTATTSYNFANGNLATCPITSSTPYTYNGTTFTFYNNPVAGSSPVFYIRSQSTGARAITTDPYYIDRDVVPHTHFLTTTYLGFLGWSTTQFTMPLPAETSNYIPNGFYEIYPNYTPSDGVDSLDSGVAYGDLLATLYPAFEHRIDQAWQVTNVNGYIEITPASNAGYALTDQRNGSGNGNPIDMEPYTGATGQLWTATQVAPLTYTLSPKSAPSLVMDANGGGGAGATVSMWSSNGGTNQQWIFVPR